MEEGESNDYSPFRNDEDEEDEENMEELEAMLYSQIYYDQSERGALLSMTHSETPLMSRKLCVRALVMWTAAMSSVDPAVAYKFLFF